ncbi:MAG TPA: hypothetical protein PLW78_02815, partial [bacterium]|nr:hypothetical protein [bacterium]
MKITILIFTLFLISCNSKSQNHDSQDEQDLHDLDNTQPDIDTSVPDHDKIDADADTDNDAESSDSDTDSVECLDLK